MQIIQVILKNLLDLKPIDGRFVSKASINRLIENTDMALSSVKKHQDTLLVYLCFWFIRNFLGLVKTIGSVKMYKWLRIDDTNVAGFFNSLKDGLNAPLQV